MRRPARPWLIAFGLLLGAARAGAQPTVLAVDDEQRLRRQDVAAARAAGHALGAPGATVDLDAFRGETVAFQIALVAGDSPIGAAQVALWPWSGEGTAPRVDVFREHTVSVTVRSHNDARPAESLGWDPGARPPDSAMLGEVPDALIPVNLDAGAIDPAAFAPAAFAPAAFAPAPFAPAGTVALLWVDVSVPDEAAPGIHTAQADVTADGTLAARFTLRLRVAPTQLPFRAASVFAYYEPARLAKRLGERDGPERQLWQLLHAHQVDAMAPLADPGEAARLNGAYSGAWFSAAAGYRGAGAGQPPAVAALGAYGTLRDPTPASLAAVDEIAALLRPHVADLFLYAIDERCDSPRAADWSAALAGRPGARGVAVGQTCEREPARQAAGVQLIPAGAFGWRSASAAAAAGKRAWIYNGHLPQTGTLLLDADPRGLIANGWIAAAAAIERWFYWETTFWDDSNAGGRGPIDPFTTAENFHNRDGDSALGDGLLVYPGRQPGPFVAHDLRFAGVLPSLRLKAIRRGVQDAGIIALAMRDRPAEAARIVARALPAALDEASPRGPASWTGFLDARAALRRLVTSDRPMGQTASRQAMLDLLSRHRPLSGRRLPPIARPIAPLAALAAILIAGVLVARSRRIRR